jgi:toxin-antitoxin system PIN domain toxin
MGGVIDTNILLYAANTDAEQYKSAREFLYAAARSTDRWYFTEGILYEFLRVSTHPKVFERPLDWRQALDFLHPFLESDRFDLITLDAGHWDVLAEMLGTLTHPAGNLFFDIRTAVLLREHGIRRIYTTDTDFLQFRDLEVVNPL